jgi:hypothetical protein
MILTKQWIILLYWWITIITFSPNLTFHYNNIGYNIRSTFYMDIDIDFDTPYSLLKVVR